MKNTTFLVGEPIEARCTKCRKNTDHIIVTVAEEGPGKVKCKICNRQGNFRSPTVVISPAAQRIAGQKDAERKEWAALRSKMNCEEARNYFMTDAYKVKELINHPLFGLGLVQRVAGLQKIEVLFEDGRKTMRCK